MTEPCVRFTEDQLRELVDHWRYMANVVSEFGDSGSVATYNLCADELESVLNDEELHTDFTEELFGEAHKLVEAMENKE